MLGPVGRRSRGLIILMAVASLSSADRLAHAKEYQPEQREALLIRPEMRVEKLRQSIPCLMPPERTKRVTWVVRAKDGTILIIGAIDVRQRC